MTDGYLERSIVAIVQAAHVHCDNSTGSIGNTVAMVQVAGASLWQ